MEKWNDGMVEKWINLTIRPFDNGKRKKWNDVRFKVKLLTSDCLLPTANW
jgi:hypothetical protein